MKKIIFILMFVSGYAIAAQITNNLVATPYPQNNGTQKINSLVRPQDDFYEYVNGTWLKNTPIPADKASWGAFSELQENTIDQLHQIINNLADDKKTQNKQKIYTLYTDFMNEARLDTLGATPLNEQMAAIDNITDKKQIPELITNLNQIDVKTPMDVNVHQDAHDSNIVIADIAQSGLGLPDRDYYLKDNDKTLKLIKQKYAEHISDMLSRYGDKNAALDAVEIVKLETRLAKIQWTNVQNRDPIKTYNQVPLDKLSTLMPNFDWNNYLTAAKLNGKISYLVISQPSYLKGLDKILQQTPLSIWKAYFKWHLLSDYSPLLSKAYDDAHFAFYSTVLEGIPAQKPRYKRAIDQIEESIGEALGELYVAKYFPPENKIKIEKLVSNLILTYRSSINSLDWMSSTTKARAQKKLNKIMLKIAYPDKWRDYSKLEIKADDLVGNVMRASAFEYNRQIDKLGKPVDRTEWQMTPQTINAYYNPELNEIVFPAAILQPPFFDVKADDAFNYGGIGAVIGHEISHAFDDQGSQYDEKGNLHNWWTKTDREKFTSKTKALVKQYAAYSPLPGYYVNGELTLGENIADNSGLAIAYKAYHLSLGENKSSLIDNFTGEQRLYLGWAEVWRNKMRDPMIIQQIKTNPHSPAKFRGNGALRNQPGFYDAFDVKPGDKMYLPPEKRVIIW
jgi:putative endopeptidase